MKLGRDRWSIETIVAIAQGDTHIVEMGDQDWQSQITRSHLFLQDQWKKEGTVYGVTTGYGDSCDIDVPTAQVEQLPIHLMRFHGCGLGAILPPEQALTVVAVQLASLSQGYSGVRFELIERMVDLLHHNIAPVIPEEGSVGASGDLTPLSYVAAVLMGERDVWYKGKQRPTADVYQELGWKPLSLYPKETLALMNGTGLMTALACLAHHRASYLLKLATRLTSMSVVAMQGNRDHFHPQLFARKPHPGQVQVAHWLYQDLDGYKRDSALRLQDRYSLRCAPHILGVLSDALGWFRDVIETELNSVSDNPILDATNDAVYHGGHFYGGHIAFVMDSLKNAIANVADLLDRQLATLVDPKMNHGLPANLSGAQASEQAIHHGLKALQIGASAWTAEALKQTMPASVFSRSTESHNQDKVSMGTIAARDCLRVLQLTEQVAAAHTVGVRQGVHLRLETNHISLPPEGSDLSTFYKNLQDSIPLLEQDRALEPELRSLVSTIQQQSWKLYNDAID